MSSITPSGTHTSAARARRIASKTGRPPMVKVGARETGLMGKVRDAVTQGNQWLSDLCMTACIDEVAIMLPESAKEAQDWSERMLDRVGPKEGITYFNRSQSTVVVHNLPSKYEVEYRFFSTPLRTAGGATVRIELMRLGNGHSPLHHLYNQPQDSRGRDACIVHASFKCNDEAEYRVICNHLASMGLNCGQDCSSDYGLFSYWRNPDFDGVLLWLKPRVNLRDVPKPGYQGTADMVVEEGQTFQYSTLEQEQATDEAPLGEFEDDEEDYEDDDV